MTDKPFLTDVQELRRRARQHIEEGAVTEGYRADRETIVRLLNEALATEIVCVLRYKRHYFMAQGIHADPILYAIFGHPLMAAFWLVIFVRSVWKTGVRRELEWRGRKYDASETRFGADR